MESFRKKSLLTLVFLLMPQLVTAGLLSPTPYVKKKQCGIRETLKFMPSCFGGYSSIQIAPKKYIVKADGNEFTTEERALSIAIKRCAELAVQAGIEYINIDSAESRTVQQVRGNSGVISTISYPVATVMCTHIDANSDTTLRAIEVFNSQIIN